MLIIAGHIEVDPARRDEHVAAFASMVERARRFDGCLDLAITADPLDGGRVNNFERWDSEEALEAWRAVCDAPETGIEILSDAVARFDVSAERPPF